MHFAEAYGNFRHAHIPYPNCLESSHLSEIPGFAADLVAGSSVQPPMVIEDKLTPGLVITQVHLVIYKQIRAMVSLHMMCHYWRAINMYRVMASTVKIRQQTHTHSYIYMYTHVK